MAVALVLLAAGFGTRFGGVKQLAPVGPGGEALLDYTIADARRAGFGPIALVVRPGIEEQTVEHLGRHHPDLTPVLAVQPQPGGRPTGTAHAVLLAADALAAAGHDDAFAVANADDHYGADAFGRLHPVAASAGPAGGALVGYRLGATVPPHGSVSRAVCRVDEGGRLVEVVEHLTIERDPAGALRSEHGPLADDALVSMNLWSFPPLVRAEVRRRWDERTAPDAGAPTGEFLLPSVVGELVTSGRLAVTVVPGPDDWFGLTNPEDLPVVQAAIGRRPDAGRLADR